MKGTQAGGEKAAGVKPKMADRPAATEIRSDTVPVLVHRLHREAATGRLILRQGPVQSITVPVGTTPMLIPENSPEILYNKALCDYRQISRGDDDPLNRSLALLNLGIAFMHFGSYDKALSDALNVANLPAGAGISRGTVRYYQGQCYLKKDLIPEARTAFQEAVTAADATLESNDGPPISARAKRLLQ